MDLNEWMEGNFLNARMVGDRTAIHPQKVRLILRRETIITPGLAEKIIKLTDGKVGVDSLRKMNLEYYAKREQQQEQ